MFTKSEGSNASLVETVVIVCLEMLYLNLFLKSVVLSDINSMPKFSLQSSIGGNCWL